MKRIAIISLFSIVIALAAASDLYACSCMPPLPNMPIKKIVSDAKASAGAVFVGKIISVRKSHLFTIEVTRSWKGVKTKQVEVATAVDSAMCGVGFEVGKEFIVYANGSEMSTLSANNCSRTQMIGGKSDDEKYLGKRLKLKAE